MLRNSIQYIFIGLALLVLAGCGASKKTLPSTSNTIYVTPDSLTGEGPEHFDSIQVKYGRVLNVTPEAIKNKQLYLFIEKWLGTPYKWGGINERGIDCSAFLQRLMAEVYAIQIPRTSVQQFFTNRIQAYASRKYLMEGDLVFFRTVSNSLVSHVGLYLHNGSFVNASSSRGVSIGNIEDPYWKSRFVAAGRVKIIGLTSRN